MKKTLALCLTLPLAGLAQTERFSSPVLGYVYDAEAKALKVLGGIPGAAGLDATYNLASKLESAGVSPNGRFALATVLDGDALLLLKLNDQAGGPIPLTGSLARPSQVVFNTAGGGAILYSKETGRLQVWSGLPAEPALVREFDADSDGILALSEDGALVASAGPAGITIYAPDSVRRISVPGSVTALSFRNGAHDLIVAAGDSIELVRAADGDGERSLLASESQGARGIVALAPSRDGRWMFAAADRSVLRIDLASGAVDATACDCRPAELSSLAGNAVFRLNGLSDGPLLLIDSDSAQPRILMVPNPGGKR